MTSLQDILQSKREEDVQRFLADNKDILLWAFATPSWAGSWCFPKFRFGEKFVSDFLLLYGHSGRYEVTLIELEPPTARQFTKSGTFARRLNEAVRQVHDWFTWIHDHPEYFRSALSEHCSEFRVDSAMTRGGCRVTTSAKIIIGRRAMLTPTDNARRHTLFAESDRNMEIVPYDRLLEIHNDGVRRDA
jgi:hypothetical protein